MAAEDTVLVTEVEAMTPPESAAIPCMPERLPHCGWLVKRKSDAAKSRFFCSSNRRYFTLDFGTKALYYSHTEANKSVSNPIAFRDIIGAEMFASAPAQEGALENQEAPSSGSGMQRSSSKGSVTSVTSIASSLRMPRIPSITGMMKPTSGEQQQQHGFALRTKGKNMDLLCASRAEAETWVEAIREAIDMARSGSPDDVVGSSKAEPSTATGSQLTSRDTSPSPQGVSPRVPEGEVPARTKAATRWVTSPSSTQAEVQAAPVAAEIPGRTEVQAAPFAAEGETVPAQTEVQAAPLAAEGETVSAQTEVQAFPNVAEGETTPVHTEVQASPQVAEGETIPAQREVQARPSDAPPTAGAWDAPEAALELMEPIEIAKAAGQDEEVLAMSNAQSPRGVGGAWTAAKSPGRGGARARYADKAEGLSLHERLNQLNLSDDEEDDETTPRNNAKGEAEQTVVKQEPGGNAGHLDEVTMDPCESFVQEPDSDVD